MKNIRLVIVTIGLIIEGYSPSIAMVYDTGWVIREQPNGTTFLGREWGDEFLYFGETRDGFRYAIDPSTGYFHYQIKNSSGDLIRSPLRVGIDNPAQLKISKHLDLSPKKYDRIKSHMRSLGYLTDEDSDRRRSIARQGTPTSGQWTLAIVLVDFSDVSPREPRYTREQFELMFFGTNYIQSPDGEQAFGSIAQYFTEMSQGNFTFTSGSDGGLLNNEIDGVLQWVRMPRTKQYYTTQAHAVSDFFAHADAAASSPPYNLDVTPSPTRKIAYIYAGNINITGPSANVTGGLIPRVDRVGGNRYVMSERTDTYTGSYFNRGETPNATFSHIGVHCHELGHLLNLNHPGGLEAMDWCLMQVGSNNGPRIASRPWQINPFYREDLGWLEPTAISSSMDRQNIEGGVSRAYSVDVHTNNDYEYILEHKDNVGFTVYVSDFQFTSAPGLFIWRRHVHRERPMLIVADNSRGRGASINSTSDDYFGDPFPGLTNNTHISDYTNISLLQIVGSSTYRGDSPRINIDNITNNETNTTIDIYINYWAGPITASTTWSGTVYVGGDVTISSGVTLTVASGTEVHFLANTDDTGGGDDMARSELIVADGGVLNAVAGTTEADHITFRSANDAADPPPYEWYGIHVESGGNATLTNVTIRDGMHCVSADDDNDLVLNNLSLANCGTGRTRRVCGVAL